MTLNLNKQESYKKFISLINGILYQNNNVRIKNILLYFNQNVTSYYFKEHQNDVHYDLYFFIRGKNIYIEDIKKIVKDINVPCEKYIANSHSIKIEISYNLYPPLEEF